MREIEYIAISKEEYDRLKAIEQSYFAELHKSKKQAEDQIRMYRQQMQLSPLGFPMTSGTVDFNDMKNKSQNRDKRKADRKGYSVFIGN